MDGFTATADGALTDILAAGLVASVVLVGTCKDIIQSNRGTIKNNDTNNSCRM